jgi:galactokinase
LQELKKQNKEAAERLRNKKNKDLEDPEKFAAGGVAGLLGERTGYAVGNQVMPAVDPRMNVDYNTLVDQNTAQRNTQAQGMIFKKNLI